MSPIGTKRTHRDSPLFVRFRGRSGHQPAIAYGHATTLSLDQPLPGTDKMKWSDDVVIKPRIAGFSAADLINCTAPSSYRLSSTNKCFARGIDGEAAKSACIAQQDFSWLSFYGCGGQRSPLSSPGCPCARSCSISLKHAEASSATAVVMCRR